MFLPLAGLWSLICGVSAPAQTITNLQQLTLALASEHRIVREVQLDAIVCAASRPDVGVLIVRDDTGVELLELGNLRREVRPGERIRLAGRSVALRKRELGVELSVAPTVNNDGTHLPDATERVVALKAGRVPVRLDWFNCLRGFALEVSWAVSNGVPQSLDGAHLSHAVVDESGRTNWLPGLRAECYEGYWETAPDFALLRPAKSGVVTNFDIGFRTRDEMVGIRFTGFLSVPADGPYTFRLLSDDGGLLFFGAPEVPVTAIGFTEPPVAVAALYGEEMSGLAERRWAQIEGRVTFVTERGAGLEFDLRSDRDVISVRVADADGLAPSRLFNSHVKIRGVAQGVLTTDRRIVLGRLFAASARDISFLAEPSLPITTIGGVQSLPIEEARQALPVRIRGVVTDAKNSPSERWMSIQDDTRGVWVNLITAANAPAFGEFWEVEGHSEAGDFAPVIVASNMTFLGNGRVPEPVHPTWNELVNGSRDVQWAELAGLVTAVQSNTVTLLLPEGQLDVLMDGLFESDLQRFEKCVVRIRGVLYAIWDAVTREVRVGNVMMRNASVHVDIPAPADPFDAVLKTPRELLLFDAQASPFRRVKVRGQIVYADATQIFLEQDGDGLQLLPAEKTDAKPGDLVEAVGYPEISKTARRLRQARLRRTGRAELPAARRLSESELTTEGLDSTRVRVEGTLLGWHFEQSAPVLEMQSGTHLFLALLAPGKARQFSALRPGSRLALTGVYVSRGRQRPGAEAESFDLLLNSPADITVLSQPSWWTLQRLLIVVGSLLVALVFVVIWNRQLQRQVEQRTAQLQRETRERERVERQHALEAERSRIARDLHDDLGSSLTEISALAATGLRPLPEGNNAGALFQAIAAKARRLIAALDEIVWAVDPEDNSLQSLADYLSGFTGEFFAHTNISCRFKVPMSLPAVTVEGRVRHDLLMAVKEALNNIVRHADATEAEFRMAVADGTLQIEIADNGKGFAGGSEKDGHGLKNLPARLREIGGDCAVDSRVDGGTTVKIYLPLPPRHAASEN
jgi:signal transduction histidine kinase